MPGGDEDDESENEQVDEDDLLFSVWPLSYYEKRGMEGPPKPIPKFLNDNYRFLAIAGVFVALIGYFAGLGPSSGQMIVPGMVGSAVLFLIAFLVVIHNGVVSTVKAYKSESLSIGLVYLAMTFSVLFIGLALVSYFGQLSPRVIEVIDAIVASTLVMGLLFLAYGGYTAPSWLDRLNPLFTVRVGPYTEPIVRNDLLISAVIHSIVLLVFLLDWVKIESVLPSEYILDPSPTLILITMGGTWYGGSFVVVVSAAFANLMYREVSRAFEVVGTRFD